MLRYVILNHDHPETHFDLMLEFEGVLKTWRLAEPLRAGEQTAQRLADHRIVYLTYEGPLAQNRGSVKRVAEGNYDIINQDNTTWHLRLHGTCHGQLLLRLGQQSQWSLAWLPE